MKALQQPREGARQTAIPERRPGSTGTMNVRQQPRKGARQTAIPEPRPGSTGTMKALQQPREGQRKLAGGATTGYCKKYTIRPVRGCGHHQVCRRYQQLRARRDSHCLDQSHQALFVPAVRAAPPGANDNLGVPNRWFTPPANFRSPLPGDSWDKIRLANEN